MNATTEIDVWAHWRDNLAGKKVPIHDGHPQCGYYKTRRGKDQPWLPAAIWIDDDGTMLARVGDKAVEPDKIWTWVAKNPMPYEAVAHHFEHGHWPEEPAPAEAEALKSNRPADPFEALKLDIAEAAERAREWLKSLPVVEGKPVVDSKPVADTGANLVTDLRAAASALTKWHKEAKEPVLRETQRLDALKRDLMQPLDDAATAIKRTLSAYETKLLKEREDAERARREAEAAALKAESEALVAGTEAPPAPELPPEPPKREKLGTKKTLAAREVWVVEKWSYAKCLDRYKDHPTVIDAVRKLVEVDIQLGDVEGVTRRKEIKV